MYYFTSVDKRSLKASLLMVPRRQRDDRGTKKPPNNLHSLFDHPELVRNGCEDAQQPALIVIF